MVTKLIDIHARHADGYVLAKIHMVTKQAWQTGPAGTSYVLAKIHMVTKRLSED